MRPYTIRIVGIFDDEEYGMKMIGHDDKLIQHDVSADNLGLPPFLLDDLSYPIEQDTSIDNLTK